MTVAGLIGSAPQLVYRMLPRSADQPVCVANAWTQAAYAKFGAPEWVIRKRSIASSQRNGLRTKAVGVIR